VAVLSRNKYIQTYENTSRMTGAVQHSGMNPFQAARCPNFPTLKAGLPICGKSHRFNGTTAQRHNGTTAQRHKGLH